MYQHADRVLADEQIVAVAYEALSPQPQLWSTGNSS